MKENSFKFTTYFTEEELNFFKEWQDEKWEKIKQWMRENNCLVYLDYSMAALRGGLPIVYTATPEDIYTKQELTLQRFKNYKPLICPTVHIELKHYNKYL